MNRTRGRVALRGGSPSRPRQYRVPVYGILKGMGKLRRDDGSTDPVLLVSALAVTLILILGGVFAVGGFVKNAQDLNAKADLDRVTSSQAAVMTASEKYLPSALGPRVLPEKLDRSLASAEVGFVAGRDNTLVIAVGATGWAAMVESASGATFLRTSESSAIVEVDVEDIRRDFDITALEGRIVDADASATTVGAKKVIRFPDDVSVYNMAWRWVDAIWGLESPAPGPGEQEPEEPVVPTPTPTPPTTEPTPTPTPTPEPTPPPLEVPTESVKPTFSAGDGARIVSVTWNQPAATQACAVVKVAGVGAEGKWNIWMNPSSVPFNGDFNRSHFSFPTWGYGFEGDFVDRRIRIVGNISDPWNNTATIREGQERQFQICNWTTPRPPVTHDVDVKVFDKNPGEWTWTMKVKVSQSEAEFFTSWKVRLDLSDMNKGFRGSGGIWTSPGAGDIKVTHVEGNVYDFEGVGWPTTGVRHDREVTFTVGR